MTNNERAVTGAAVKQHYTLSGVMELVLKRAYLSDILSFLKQYLGLLQEFYRQTDDEALNQTLTHVMMNGAARDEDKEEIVALLRTKFSEKIGDDMGRCTNAWEKIGMKKGMEKGREGGWKGGMEKGILRGRKEGWQGGLQESRQVIARNLLLEGLSVEFVGKTTGLPVEHLLTLQQSIKQTPSPSSSH